MKSLESDVIELLASWGAVARPGSAEILRALAGLGGPDILQVLHRKGRGLLSDSLWTEIDQALAILADSDAWRAPSFRSRTTQCLEAAGAELRAVLDRKRDTLVEELGASAPFLPWDELRRIFERVWTVDRARSPDRQMAAIEDLERIRAVIEEARSAVRRNLEELVASSPETPATAQALGQGREALASNDLKAVSVALADLRSAGSQTRMEERAAAIESARQSLAALNQEARERMTDPARPLGPGDSQLLGAIVEGAEQALSANSGNPSGHVEVIQAWEGALQGVLGADDESTGSEARKRFLEELNVEIDRHEARLAGTADPAAGDSSIDLDPADGPAFRRGVAGAVQQVRVLKRSADSALEKAAAALHAATRKLGEFLEKNAKHVSTSRVVQARLWIDQADGIIAGQNLQDIESLEATIRKEMDETSAAVAALRRRQKDSEEADREALLGEIQLLEKAASGRAARRLSGLAGEARSAGAEEILDLEDRLEDLRRTIEQPIRIAAGKTLHSCDRWLSKAGAAREESSSEIKQLRDELQECLLKDDPVAIRDRASSLRTCLLRVAPLKRPVVRITIVSLVLLMGATGVYFVGVAPGGGQTYHVRFQTPPAAPAKVTIVQDGRIVGTSTYGPGDTQGVAFSLDKGRYEIFVNDQYTGKTFVVPDHPETIEIPRPVDAP